MAEEPFPIPIKNQRSSAAETPQNPAAANPSLRRGWQRILGQAARGWMRDEIREGTKGLELFRTEPAACLGALGNSGIIRELFGIVLLAQFLKGVPTPQELGSAEPSLGNDAGFVSSANSAMFYGEIKMEEAPGIFKLGKSRQQLPLRSCLALILFLTGIFRIFPAGFLKAFFTFSV